MLCKYCTTALNRILFIVYHKFDTLSYFIITYDLFCFEHFEVMFPSVKEFLSV